MKMMPAPPFRRLFAYLIDWYLAALVCGIPLQLVNSVRTGSTAVNSSVPPGAFGLVWGLLAVFVGAAYYWLIPVVWNGLTPGKRLFHLRIVDSEGHRPSAGALLLRQVVGILLVEGAVAFPSQLFRELLARIAGDGAADTARIIMVAATMISIGLGVYTVDKRMLHDYISGTYEVWEKEE